MNKYNHPKQTDTFIRICLGISSYFIYIYIYIKGDAFIIAPFLILIFIIGFMWSWSFSLFTLAVFHTVRSLGEMMFWLLQQFGPHEYRPYDFGLLKLNTNAIYILYQVHACVQTVIGVVCSVYV